MFSVVFSVLVFFGVYDMCRSKLERDKDRDVSEKIALGLPSGPPSQESLFDQRLFGQSKVGPCCVALVSGQVLLVPELCPTIQI